MTREEIEGGLKFTVDMFKFDPLTGEERTLNELDATAVGACEEAIKVIDDFETLNAINLDLASENEDLEERIGKLIGYIDFLRNTAQGKKKSLNLLEKVVKGQIKEIRAEGENFVKPKTGEWIPVTERLPEYRKEVLTCSNGGFIEIQSLEESYGGYWENQKGDWSDFDEVIAWMPLPQPYKVESEG